MFDGESNWEKKKENNLKKAKARKRRKIAERHEAQTVEWNVNKINAVEVKSSQVKIPPVEYQWNYKIRPKWMWKALYKIKFIECKHFKSHYFSTSVHRCLFARHFWPFRSNRVSSYFDVRIIDHLISLCAMQSDDRIRFFWWLISSTFGSGRIFCLCVSVLKKQIRLYYLLQFLFSSLVAIYTGLHMWNKWGLIIAKLEIERKNLRKFIIWLNTTRFDFIRAKVSALKIGCK